MYDKLGNVSNSAVLEATGRSWKEWVEYIDKMGGADMSHTEIVKALNESGEVKNSWWQQTVAVGYEYAKNRRVVGETATAKFELGVQKTMPMERTRLWQFLFTKEALTIWLGNIETFIFDLDILSGGDRLPKVQVRSIKLNEKIRMLVQTETIHHPFILQINLMCSRNSAQKTSLRFHFEKLDSSEERDMIRNHYKEVMEQLHKLVTTHPKKLPTDLG